jgi:hypothetical protein
LKPAIHGGSAQPRGNGVAHDRDCRCPTCDSPISFEKLASIEGKGRAHDAEIERAAEARFTREMAKFEATKKADIAKARREAVKVVETRLTAMRANQDAVIAERLEAHRQTFEKATASAVLAERAKYLGEKLKLEEQLQDMQRRLQAKTAHQLGEPPEVDLYDALAAAFPEDRVSRVVKGVRGPDVLVEVLHHDAVIGKVVLDSKNHARWSNKFTQKLRSDQLAEGADFAILSSNVFPAGARQLHMQDNVVIADPARVVVLVHLLRKQIVDNFMQKLGSEARASKADAMYDFILSPGCDDLFDKLLKLTRDLSALDEGEVKAHRSTWVKRAQLVLAVNSVREEFVGVVAEIIGGGR